MWDHDEVRGERWKETVKEARAEEEKGKVWGNSGLKK